MPDKTPDKTPAKSHLLARRPRTRRNFGIEDMERMYALYYNPAIRVSQVAAAFDVPSSTFLRWIDEMQWPTRRQIGAAARTDTKASDAERDLARALRRRGATSPSSALDYDRLRTELARTARTQLAALQARRRGAAPDDIERDARIIASLARSIERLDANIWENERRQARRAIAANIRRR